ncbi:MAG: hypothetical protein JO006_09270 [Paucibacter sp.]|nr:hypothetical protein [Roseateles sp.]
MSPKVLFRSAAVFNWLAAGAVLLMPAALAQRLDLPPPPIATVYGQLACMAIAVFGGMYWMVARDNLRYRPFVAIAIVTKFLAVAIVTGQWTAGTVAWPLAALSLVDIAWAVIFWRFLRRDGRARCKACT